MTKQTFKTGKIRRNAFRKIDALLTSATKIVGHFSTRRVDDAYDLSEETTASINEVKSFIENTNSRYLNIWLECDEQGNPVSLRVDGAYWQDDFYITFETVEEKPRFTMEQVTEALEAGFVSPLNSDEKEVQQNEQEPAKQARSSEIGRYLETLIEEKGADTEDEIKIAGHFGLTYEILIDYIETAGRDVQTKIRNTCVQIDYKSGDVFHYLNHLGKGMAQAIAIH
ncbi:hypothetical protein NVP1151O_38 [Vibrio phage 1.151.O._10N.222.46.B1]|nr:hypothetical protein NVP1151O_38 [Vibrio phage 1.151.O._10N.222.46.B1]